MAVDICVCLRLSTGTLNYLKELGPGGLFLLEKTTSLLSDREICSSY